MPLLGKIILRTIYYAALVYFTFLMVLITLQYVPINYSAAFLNLKEEAIAFTHYKISFFTHVYTSIFVLILGIPQFSDWVRLNYKKAHKLIGSLYIGIILLLASPSGLVMAFYANGGIGSKISFSIQAILWFVFTLIAYRSAMHKRFKLHRNYMLRSYALTLSAISLRLFKWIIVSYLEWPPMDTYRLVSWMGWMVNILIIELYIRYTQAKI